MVGGAVMVQAACLGFAAALVATRALAGADPGYGPPADWVKPIPIPKETAASADGAPAQVLLYSVQSKFGLEGDEYAVDRVVKILSSEGLSTAGTVEEVWDPDTEDLTIHHLRVIRGEQVIDALAGGRKMLVLRRENKLELAMLDGRLTATLEPEGLQVGDLIDFAYTVKRHDPALRGHSEDYERLSHAGTAAEIYWRGFWPASKPVRWRVTEGLPQPTVAKTNAGTELSFDMRSIAAPKPPAGAPPRYKDMGSVEFSQYASWAELSALLDPLYDKATTLQAGSPLMAEVAKIAAASPDPKTRATAALRLVEEQTRYVFLGMNDGGLVPAAADDTWSRRFGDCKGKTALLVAILRQLGVTAEPVLVSTTFGDGMDQRLPMAGWFDHAIVRAEIDGKTYWLDGTRNGDRSLDDLVTPPFYWALPIHPSGSNLVRLDPQALDLPGTAETLTVDSSRGADAPAPTHIEVVYRGEFAVALRASIAAVPKGDFERYLREFWTKAYPWLDVQTVSMNDDPAHAVARLSADGVGRLEWVQTGGGARIYHVPHSALGWDVTFKRQAGPHQDAPYAVPFPIFATSSQRITLPKDGDYAVLGKNINETIAGVELIRTLRMESGGVVAIDVSTRSVAREFPAAEAEADGVKLRDLAQKDVAIASQIRIGLPSVSPDWRTQR